MFCSHCGNEIDEGAAFCSSCGKPIGRSGETIVQQTITESGQNKTSKHKIYEIVSGAVVLFSTFFPYITVSFLGIAMSKSLMETEDGIILIFIAAVGIVGALLGKDYIVIVAGALSLVAFFGENALIKSNMSESEFGDMAQYLVQNGVGYYLLLLGAIGMVVTGIVRVSAGKGSQDHYGRTQG